MRRALLVLAVLLALAVSATGPAAGAPGPGGVKLTPLESTFPERSYILTLPPGVRVESGAIRLLENGAPVNQLAVAPRKATRTGTVLLIDASESMKGAPIEAAMQAARVFAGHRKPGQKLAVVAYNADATVLLPFTSDSAKIEAALATTPPVRYFTRMYDAVREVAGMVRRERLESTAIVLLSDGQELDSAATREQATAAARSADARIFSVALMSRFFDSSTLETLAGRTGGDYLEASNPNALIGIYDRLGYSLANEYLVQYRSFAGPEEKVEVSVAVRGVEKAGSSSYQTPPLTTAPPPAFSNSRVDEAVQSGLTMILIIALAAALLGVAATSVVRPEKRVLQQRLGAFVSLGRPKDGKRQSAVLSERVLTGTERSLSKTRWWPWFKEELEVAEIRLPAEQVVVLTAIGTLLAAWLISIVFGSAAAILGFTLPLAIRWLIKFRADRQRRHFADQLPDNLQVLSAALRAGHSMIGALSVMVEDAPEPSRREFRRVVADEQLGVPLDESFSRVATRMKSRDLEQVALVAALQRDTGGNSAEVLDRVAETIRDRAALRRLVRTLTAQGRMARWIVSSLPIGLLLIISVLNSEYMEPLFSKTAGRVMLGFAAAMVVAGSLVIRRIVNIKV